MDAAIAAGDDNFPATAAGEFACLLLDVAQGRAFDDVRVDAGCLEEPDDARQSTACATAAGGRIDQE